MAPAEWHGTAHAPVARHLLAFATSRGDPMPALLARYGLSAETLDDPEGRVPLVTVKRLWEDLDAQTQPEDLPLVLRAWFMQRRAEPALDELLLLASPTFRAGLERIIRYERLTYDNAEATVDFYVRDGLAEILVDPDRGAFVPPPAAVAFAFTGLPWVSRLATGRALPLREVSLRYRCSAESKGWKVHFGITPRFDAPADRMVFDADHLDAPIVTANGALARVLERHAEGMLATLPTRTPLMQVLREAVRALLPDGEVTLQALAKRLGTSARSLQRKVAAEGLSTSRVVDDVRHELARAYLRSPQNTLVDVAFALGFADQSAFHRAFVRWTGATPGEYRKQLR